MTQVVAIWNYYVSISNNGLKDVHPFFSSIGSKVQGCRECIHRYMVFLIDIHVHVCWAWNPCTHSWYWSRLALANGSKVALQNRHGWRRATYSFFFENVNHFLKPRTFFKVWTLFGKKRTNCWKHKQFWNFGVFIGALFIDESISFFAKVLCLQPAPASPCKKQNFSRAILYHAIHRHLNSPPVFRRK